MTETPSVERLRTRKAGLPTSDPAAVGEPPDGQIQARWGWRDAPRLVGGHPLAIIVVAQAVYLAILMHRGWFYADDVSFIAEAHRDSMSWGYLTSAVNDHLSPGLRSSYWLISRTTRYHYTPTIVVRLVLQAAATVLLFRVVTQLRVPRRAALVVVALYAFNPLLVPPTLYLSNAINEQPAQIFALLAIVATIRYDETHRRRWAFAVGIALLAAACFWEKTAIVTVLVIVFLRFGWLGEGRERQRLRRLLLDVPGWLLILIPIAGFGAYFIAHHYGGSSQHLTVGDIRRVAVAQWLHALWPSVVGGPWLWHRSDPSLNDAPAQSTTVAVVGQVAMVLLVVLAWRRVRWRALLAVLVVLGQAIVAAGRLRTYGLSSTLDFHYAYDLAVPLAIAAALCLRGQAGSSPAHARSGWSLSVVAGAAALIMVVASSVVTGARWTTDWARNPTHTYLTTLFNSARAAGPQVNIYDTTVSASVLPIIERYRFLSDLLPVAGITATYDGESSTPQVVDSTGRLRASVFFNVAFARLTNNKFCAQPVNGVQTFTLHLDRTISTPNDYFLQLAYFQQRPSQLTISVHDSQGRTLALRDGSTIDLDGTLAKPAVPIAYGIPATITVTSHSLATASCLTGLAIGSPLPLK